jgi:hypothetical protein
VFTARAGATALEKIGPEFERVTGHRLNVIYDADFDAILRHIAANEPFDVVIRGTEGIDSMIKDGTIAEPVQYDYPFAAGISANSKAPDAALDLIKFLTGPVTIPVFKSQVMEPGRTRRDFRFGSLADLPPLKSDFRFTPQSRHPAGDLACPLSAKRGSGGCNSRKEKAARRRLSIQSDNRGSGGHQYRLVLPAIGKKANPRETEQNHGPSGWFGYCCDVEDTSHCVSLDRSSDRRWLASQKLMHIEVKLKI